MSNRNDAAVGGESSVGNGKPEVLVGDERSRPLVPDDPECTTNEELIYDESGALVAERAIEPEAIGRPTIEGPRPVVGPPIVVPTRPCRLRALDGSWYVELTPEEKPSRPVQIHGAMRVESGDRERVRVSADLYTEPYRCEKGGAYRPVPQNPVRIDRNWYPQFPEEHYSYYVASRGAYYRSGTLQFKVGRSIWDPTAEDFTRSDRGWFQFTCKTSRIVSPIVGTRTLRMTGEAMLGGVKYRATAEKTSPYYRGCVVEVDVMREREWTPTAARPGGGSVSFNGVYREAGLEFLAVMDEVDVPEDANLTITELHTLLSSHRDLTSLSPHDWRLWLVIGSRLGTGGTLGIMFDSLDPFREGAASFADPKLPDIDIVAASARDKPIGEVPQAILRTSIHEIGHAFNLFHPKSDVHGVPTGTTIMNQTGDVFGFATAANPYPDNATFAFHQHNRASLIHDPDPQVKPGWMPFGYNHGGGGNAPSGPSDTVLDATRTTEGLVLDLELPAMAYTGELLIADVSLRNVGDHPRNVTAALNSTEDYLTITVTPPGDAPMEVRNIVLACSDRRTVELEPDESLTGHVQLLYTNREYAFDRPGRYVVRAELDTDEGTVRSDPVTVTIRSPATDEETALGTLAFDPDVGRSLALGDVLVASAAEEKLERIAEDHPETDTGVAAGVVLANASARDVRDFRADEVVRSADESRSDGYLNRTLEGADTAQVARITAALLMPGEAKSPIVDRMRDRFDKGEFDDEDVGRAEAVFDDFDVITGAA